MRTYEKIRAVLKRYQEKDRFAEVSCFSCGRNFAVSYEHVRVYNYCGRC